ncbi:WD repeat-containing protein 36 [Halyomorpha halys]|uniref:WD repeat-containing protein 36 n=1 Tax=Halyomorpha halys TaxID=286706 RepID=UPI0006D50B15|nr:WD repeat-containing protein 36 [Halyomorpha halys]
MMPISSKIFLKNRALGYVSNHVPCVIRFSRKREEFLINTCVGKAFHTYGSNHLKLLAVSDSTSEEINCLATDRDGFFTASGSRIYSWRRNSEIKCSFEGHANHVTLLLPFGRHLISVDEDNVLKVWERKTQECILTLDFGIETFKITSIAHPSTYINKILLGSEQGMLQLWNIKTSALVHTFNGWGATVTVLEQSPAVDVFAIGLSNGRIILHNLKFDETVVDFKQDWGPVTCISFRTDGAPIMATGSTVGNIVLWNLEERKVASQLLDVHGSVVSSVICFPNQPLMVSSSSDNSLKIWIFDQPDFGGRLLRLREGHASPPTHIRFYGKTSNHVLSAGRDSSLRVFNTITETLNYSLGRASYDRKVMQKKKWTSEYLLMPPIIEFSSSLVREKEWDNIAAIHLGIPEVTSWSYDKRRMGSHKLLPERLQHRTRVTITDIATSVYVTNCGNFVVIGYSSGHVDRFNIQSGIHRCTYGNKSAHKGSVRGVAVDALNQIVLSGCNSGYFKFWPFPPSRGSIIRAKPLHVLNLGDGVSFFRTHEESSLIGIILENFMICLVDIEARRVVRKLSGHTGQITDACFSPDARWIVTASMDSTIRTWDVPTASLIDIFKVDTPCTSLSMSITGHYLATTHVDNLGIYLWTNKTLFSLVPLKPIKESDNIPLIDLPSTGVETAIPIEESEEENEDEASDSKQQIEDLITLSDLAASRWKNLLDIDTIKTRNKPKEAPKAPPKAPFFLPTLPGKDIVFDYSSLKPDDGLKTVRLDKISNYTIFGQMLMDTKDTNNYSPVIDKMKTMSPSGLDFEINSLGLEAEGSIVLLRQFMAMIEYMFSTNQDFELAQSYFAIFLRSHRSTLTEDKNLHQYLKQIESAQLNGWNKLENDLMFCLSVINVLKM